MICQSKIIKKLANANVGSSLQPAPSKRHQTAPTHAGGQSCTVSYGAAPDSDTKSARQPAVLEAVSITEALPIVRRQTRPDLLLDVVMPGINGLGGLRLLRQACPKMRIAVLSAVADTHMENEALTRGADGFISKSADADETHRAVHALLDGLRYFPTLDSLPLRPPAPA